MYLLPAIDLYEGKAVRLVRGDYAQMTVYSDDPPALAHAFEAAGAEHLHLVDLEGAKAGETPNFETVRRIVAATKQKAEIGGGIRSEDVIERYLDAGVWRVILGTAALCDPQFLERAVKRFGARVAVGVDVRDGFVATHGWLETSSTRCEEFLARLSALGVQGVICTDISKDGLLAGTNLALYERLSAQFPQLALVASGGVTTLSDVRALAGLGLYGAILGKALYEKKIDLAAAIAAAKERP